jgi:hypothetical protein
MLALLSNRLQCTTPTFALFLAFTHYMTPLFSPFFAFPHCEKPSFSSLFNNHAIRETLIFPAF